MRCQPAQSFQTRSSRGQVGAARASKAGLSWTSGRAATITLTSDLKPEPLIKENTSANPLVEGVPGVMSKMPFAAFLPWSQMS